MSRVLTQDFAESPASSYWPDNSGVVDSLADTLRDALAPFIPRQQQAAAFAAIDETLAEHEDAPAPSRGALLFEVKRAIYNDTRLPIEVRLQAAADGIAAADPYFSKPYQFYADQFGITRACVHSRARKTQRVIGIRARRDKSESAREQSRESASHSRSEPRPPPRRILRPAADWCLTCL